MARKNKLTQSEIDGVQYRRSKTWQIALAQMCNGSAMIFYSLMTLLSYLANAGYGMVMGIAGVLLTVTRVFDGLIDPLISLMIDRVNTRFGKIRVFLLLGWAIRSVAALALFVWFSGKGHGIVLFVAVYLLYIIGTSIQDIAGNMLPAVMSNDPKQRPVISVWSTVYSYLFPMILSVVSTMIILPMYGNQYTAEMLSYLCLLYIPISLVLLVISCIGVSGMDKPELFQSITATGEEDKVKPRDMWELVKSNRPFQRYIVSAVSDKLAQQTVSQSIVSTLLFGIAIGNIQFGTMLSIISMLPAIVFAIIGAKHAGRAGNKEVTVLWTKVSIIIAALSVVFCGVIDMRQISSNFIFTAIFFVLLLAMSGAKMCITTANGAMRADIIDYELDRSGKYLPAVVTATYNFIDQFVSSLGATIAAVGVSLIGYTTTAPQPTDAPTPAIKWMALFLYYGMPILGWICTLVAMKGYHLDKKEMVEVQKRIVDKKEAILKNE